MWLVASTESPIALPTPSCPRTAWSSSSKVQGKTMKDALQCKRVLVTSAAIVGSPHSSRVIKKPRKRGEPEDDFRISNAEWLRSGSPLLKKHWPSAPFPILWKSRLEEKMMGSRHHLREWASGREEPELNQGPIQATDTAKRNREAGLVCLRERLMIL